MIKQMDNERDSIPIEIPRAARWQLTFENSLEVENPKKEKLTYEEKLPIFEKMPVSIVTSVQVASDSAAQGFEPRIVFFIEPRRQLGHLLHGHERKQPHPTHRRPGIR